MALFVIVLTTVLALSPAVAQQPSPDDNHLIVPGQRIGPVRLGAIHCDGSDLGAQLEIINVTRVVDMSEPSKTGKVRMLLESQDSTPARSTRLIVTFVSECKNGSTRLLAVGILDDPNQAFATTDGLHVGASEKQVRVVLGEPNRDVKGGAWGAHSRVLMYSSGIFFIVSNNDGENKVTGIGVRAPNCLEDEPCG